MKDEKSKALLQEAISEIRMLRRQNELMGARLGGFEDALLLLRTTPLYPGQGCMSQDVTYNIEKYLASEETEHNNSLIH